MRNRINKRGEWEHRSRNNKNHSCVIFSFSIKTCCQTYIAISRKSTRAPNVVRREYSATFRKKIRISRMLNKRKKQLRVLEIHVDVCPARKKKISHNARFCSLQNIQLDNSDFAGCSPSCEDSLHFYRAIIAYDPREQLRYRVRARERPSGQNLCIIAATTQSDAS